MIVPLVYSESRDITAVPLQRKLNVIEVNRSIDPKAIMNKCQEH